MIRIPVERTVVEKVQVPEGLLEPCPEPDLAVIETTQDVERIAGEALASLASCNQDKERIRSWQESGE